jgi:putative DNA methylase
MKSRKKLIEVALPLPEINDASGYDKMPGIGPHPKGIHHWWARLPLPTARAVLFASVVDDPSSNPEKWKTEAEQVAERERLFDIIREMMGKKMHESPTVYSGVHSEMLKHTNGKLPLIFDPFSGGGSIPLEANRLGFESKAGDLNPIAVLLNKCNLELAPRWAGASPVNPDDRRQISGEMSWQGARGLASDVRYYGQIIRKQLKERVGHLYPTVSLPKQFGGGKGNVITWIWARTVASPDPAMHGKHVPLISTFWLSSKKGSEAWLHPVVDKTARSYRFEIRTGSPKHKDDVSAGTKNAKGGFRCLLSDAPIPFEYVRSEGQHGRIGYVMLAVVAELSRGRVFLAPTDEQIEAASTSIPSDIPDTDLPDEALGFRVQNYGIRKHWQMFTPRQLCSLVALSDLVKGIDKDIRRDALAAGMASGEADDYSRAIRTFLALALDRCASFNNALCRWNGSQTVFLFTRQAISMLWDFSEPNILGEKAVCWHTAVNICADAIETIQANPKTAASANQIDAATGARSARNVLVSTDPPYYDNIGYAALSDFFYVWLRRTIGELYPDLFGTVLVPKLQELTAAPERFEGDKHLAREHFEGGFRKAFAALRDEMDPQYPLTVYYAFKQADEESGADESEETATVDLTTGWETLLEALVSAGFQITGTWPVRASFKWRVRALGANALASYIVLACRQRPSNAPQTDRRAFVSELKRELPTALRRLQQGNIAPVDFAQAAIGPGMSIFSQYGRILESGGNQMSVRTALSLINQTLTEVLSEQEDDFDNDTRWAIAWFEQQGFGEGEFGQAELLSKAKVTSVSGLQHAGIIASRAGKVRLLQPKELPADWDPETDRRLTIWELTHHLLRIYYFDEAGEARTAELLSRIGARGEIARELAYRLFDICERKKRSQEAQAYNALVLAWPEIARLARERRTVRARPTQTEMYT